MTHEARIRIPGAGIDPATHDDTAAGRAALSSRALWKDVCDSVADIVFETDAHGRFVFLSPRTVMGYRSDELLGRSAADIFSVRGSTARSGFNAFQPPLAIRMRRVWLRRRDGTTAVFAMSAQPTPSGGARGIGIDVTDQEEACREAEAEARMRSVLDRIVARMREEVLAPGIIRAGLDELTQCVGAQGAAIVCLERDAAAAGAGIDAATATAPHQVGEGFDDLAAFLGMPSVVGSVLEDELAGPPEIGCRAASGRALLTCPIRNRFGLPGLLAVWRREGRDWRPEERSLAASMALTLRNPLETDHIAREMTRQARTDILTGLLHRRSFAEEVQRRLDRLDRNSEHATILSIDLDDFGSLNAECGQEAGDEALRHAAAILRDAVRPTDLVGRIGADEFAIWLDGADGFAAAERAEGMCRNGIPILADTEIHRLGLSIGLASRSPRSVETFESLLRRADVAVAQAKRAGKGAWRASQQEIET